MYVEKQGASSCEDEKQAAVSSHWEVRSEQSEAVIKVGFVEEMKREKKVVVDKRADVDHEVTMS